MITPQNLPTQFREVVRAEAGLREAYLSFSSEETVQVIDSVSKTDLLQRSAAFLELYLVDACLVERLNNSTAREDAPPSVSELFEYVRTVTKLDPRAVISDGFRVLGLTNPSAPSPRITMDGVVRVVRSTLASCPIEYLVRAAAKLDLEPIGHRCRTAFDGLQAFLVRSDPSRVEAVRVLGEAYMAGAASIPQVARILNCTETDAVALVESYGYARPLDRTKLPESERSDILETLRQERVRRVEKWPLLDEGFTSRNVIASERIEGIDARRWI